MFEPGKLKEIVGEPVAFAPLKKQDPFSLDSLIAWLEKQPGGDRYDYSCNGHCLIAQYFSAQGVRFRSIAGSFWSDEKWTHNAFPTGFNEVAVSYPWTFSAALSRARALRDAP